MTSTNENTRQQMRRIHEMRLKYDPLFWRQPNVYSVAEGYFRDGKGGWLSTLGIVVSVSEKADQSTLSIEDRIPNTLEGVPVQIIEEPNEFQLRHLLVPGTEDRANHSTLMTGLGI